MEKIEILKYMKEQSKEYRLLTLILAFTFLMGCQEKKKSSDQNLISEKDAELSAQSQTLVPLIFDTDIAEDYDDVGSMAMLHAFADMGEIEILATISSNSYELTGPTLSVLNTYFGRPNTPIGVTRSMHPNRPCKQGWAQVITTDYPHALKSNDDAMGAVDLYRKILSKRPDSSVTIVTVGFLTNIANLINSEPDEFSPLNGKELVVKKVKSLVSMAASLEKDPNKGREYNVFIDSVAAQIVFNEWENEFILSPFEVGVKILTGIPLINNDSIANSPVKNSYRIALEYDKNTKGRMSWDQTAVLVAARGIEPYFKSRMLNMKIEDDGTNIVIPGNRITYISFKQTPEQITEVIETMMAHAPQSKN